MRQIHLGYDMVKLTITGTEGVVRNMFALDKLAVEGMKKAVRRSGRRVQRGTKQLCPEDTGWMKEHVRLDISRTELTFEVGWRAEDFVDSPTGRFYPPYVEYGTSRNKAQPSLTPTWETEHPRFTGDIRAEVQKAIRRRRRNK